MMEWWVILVAMPTRLKWRFYMPFCRVFLLAKSDLVLLP